MKIYLKNKAINFPLKTLEQQNEKFDSLKSTIENLLRSKSKE